VEFNLYIKNTLLGTSGIYMPIFSTMKSSFNKYVFNRNLIYYADKYRWVRYDGRGWLIERPWNEILIEIKYEFNANVYLLLCT
jgi:hypothetical protein